MNSNILTNLNIPVSTEVTCIQDVANNLVGLKRGFNTEYNPNKIAKESLTIENIHKELLSNDIINYYEIILTNNIIYIDLINYKIKLFQNSNSITISIIDIRGVPIQLHEIDFSTPCKNYYSTDKLIEEIERIINCNYNIDCYYEIFELETRLKVAGFKTEISNSRLFVTIPRNGINVRLNLFYPYKSIGNRGRKYGDPQLPTCLKAIIFNVDFVKIRTVLKLNFTGMSFRNFSNLKKFLTNFDKYKIITNTPNSNSNSDTDSSNSSVRSNSLSSTDSDESCNIEFSRNINVEPEIKKFCCKNCDYRTNVKQTFISHTLSKHSTLEERKSQYPYYCDKCDVGTMIASIFRNHCETQSHLRNIKN